MKNLFNTVKDSLMTGLVVIGILLSSVGANAGSFVMSTNLNANASLLLIPTGADIESITVVNTNAATRANVYFYISPTASRFFTNGSYTTYSYSAGSNTVIYTNFFGQLTTNSYPALLRTTNTVAAGTNSFPLLYGDNVNSNTTVTYAPPNSVRAGLGLMVTNSAAVNVTITYTQ